MLSVFNIQRYSLDDGKGIRTNVFFKGCPLHCLWCNNPESIEFTPSLMFDERCCHKFGDCLRAGDGQIYLENNKLVIKRDHIRDPQIYNNICPSKALIVSGQEKSVFEILNEIEKDIPFYKMSEGGVTLTGGEPLAQGPELKVLITELKKHGIHISVETSLHLPWKTIKEYTSLIDLFLADLKHTDNKKFREYTGGDVNLVTRNFEKLDKTGRKFIVRIPVIPDFNNSVKELTSLIDFASELKNVDEIHFIPFHSLAKEKYKMLGIYYKYSNQKPVEKSELTPFTEYAQKKGLIAKILN